MARKYRTAKGVTIDMEAMRTANEKTVASGNMKVNARGDLIDSNNRPINTRNQQVDRQYRRQTTNVSNTSVQQARTAAAAVDFPAPPEDFQDDFVKPADAAVPAAATGLAAAIARARQVRQEPLKTPREIAQHQEGVKKL